MIDLSAWARYLIEAYRRAAVSFDGKRAPARSWLVALLVAATGLCVLAPMTPAALPNGDAALYAQQAMGLDFSQRSVHLGYFAFAALLTGFADDPPDRAFNLLSAVVASATMALIFWMTSTATGRRDLGLLAAFSLLGSYTFVRNAVWAEIYIVQAFFFVLACWLFWRLRPAAAGLALAASVLVSPSILLGVPGLCAARPRLRGILKLGLVGGAVFSACLLWVWQDYFFGARGLLAASGSTASLPAAAIKEGFELLFGATALLPFLLVGAWALAASRDWWPLLAALGVLWLPTFLLGERFADVPVQLPTWILLAPVMALGAARLERLLAERAPAGRGLWLAAATLVACLPLLAIPVVAPRARTFAALPTPLIAGLLTATIATGFLAGWVAWRRPRLAPRVAFGGWLIVGLVLTVPLVGQQNQQFEGYRRDVLALGRASPGDFLAVGSWEQGILMEHYLFRRSYTGLAVELADREDGTVAGSELELAMDRGTEIWLLGDFPRLAGELEGRGRRFEQVGELWRVSSASGAGASP